MLKTSQRGLFRIIDVCCEDNTETDTVFEKKKYSFWCLSVYTERATVI